MNKVELTGRIANDLDIRKIPSGTSILTFNLAVDRGTKDTNGEKVVDFIRIQAWDRKAEYLYTYAEKGCLIGVTGSLRVEKYTKDGQTLTSYCVNADQVEILVFKKKPDELVKVGNDIRIDEIKDDDLSFV